MYKVKFLDGSTKEFETLQGANLRRVDLRMVDLRETSLQGADLRKANLRKANLREANLRWANLEEANLRWADLRRADLQGANLQGADLRWADLRRADLREADLRGANLSETKGLLDPSNWLKENFIYTNEGLIVYKAESHYYEAPSNWVYSEGNVLTEVVNPNRTDDCGCGINFATTRWIRSRLLLKNIWECLIPFEHLPSIIVPYNTDGKARCGYLKLLRLTN